MKIRMKYQKEVVQIMEEDEYGNEITSDFSD